MINIKKFVFNAFQVNTYVLYDETKACVIIDPANYDGFEDKALKDFIEKENLNVKAQLYTHCHIDHVLGSAFVGKTYNVGMSIHEASRGFLEKASSQANVYGFNLKETAKVDHIIKEGDNIIFGNSEMEVVYTPGHADGSVCFINHAQKFVITGDVLFYESIGRSDLPTGNLDLLFESITKKLFTLDDNYTVYPGHGPETSIGHEKVNNPFL
ncbi:MAG: MBL fold metallo-hydrolase [Bacteroidetes bacterium]|nr:MBL fold metallo-hydrolase [Bacteroidota bacterium]